MESSLIRNRLRQVIEDNGIKLIFIAKQLGWNYKNLISFKNNKLEYSQYRLQQLDQFLSNYK